VKDLSVGYKNIVITTNINFELTKGELMAIVGVNGIGKSTLLRTLGRMQPKLSGAILVHGKKLNKLKSLELASKMSIVLTEPVASKNMSVLELVSLGRQPYTNWIGALSSTDKQKIKEAINLLKLKDLKHHKCYTLSDGQLQRVLLARAVAQDTDILILDEPTTHLDLHHKVQTIKLLQHIANHTKKTILFTSHEIEMTLQLCDKILVLDGKNNSFGTPKQLIEEKAFERLFPSDTIVFDAENQTFKIKK